MSPVSAHHRLMLALATVGLLVSVSGCASGGLDDSTGDSPVIASATAGSTGPTANDRTGAVDSTEDTTDSEPGGTVRRPGEATRGPSRAATPGPTMRPTQGVATPVTSRTIVPRPTYSPHTICPDISQLRATFSVKRLGVDPGLGTDLVELSFTYTNAQEHALFLMGSVGYVDSRGYESDLYSRPGGLVFDDFRLERGTHTVVVELEDVQGEATESSVYFTYWSLAGAALDSSRPIPCEPNRGYSSH